MQPFVHYHLSCPIPHTPLARKYYYYQLIPFLYFRYHELLFIIDTCQAVSMFQQFYSPNLLGVGSSQVGEDSLSVRTLLLSSDCKLSQYRSLFAEIHSLDKNRICNIIYYYWQVKGGNFPLCKISSMRKMVMVAILMCFIG